MRIRYLFLSFILLSCTKGIGQKHFMDSLDHALKKEKEDTNKVNTLNLFCTGLWQAGRYDTAMVCANSELALAEKLEFKKGMAVALRNKGIVYLDKSNYSNALQYLFKAVDAAKEAKNKKELAADYLNIGIVYKHEGIYPQSLEYHFKALSLYQEIGSKAGIASEYGNIGTIYYVQNNFSRALDYYFKALTLNQQVGNKFNTAVNLGNIGTVYQDLANYPKALDYDFKSLAIQQELGYKHGIGSNFTNIGGVYMDQGNYLKALEYNFKALTINREIGSKESVANNLGVIGVISIRQKNYRQAKVYLDSCLNMCKPIGVKDQIKDMYGELTTLDSATGNYRTAFEDYKKYIVYRDSLMNDATAKKLLQAQMNYDFQRKTDSTKAEQDRLNLIEEKKSQQQKLLLYSFIGGFALMVALALLIFIGYRQKQRSNKMITLQKELVEGKNHEILDSITYAKRLQEAILPPISLLKKHLPESFLLYKPKDIVAGDFYWLWSETTSRHPSPGGGPGDIVLVAVADCTGHGVPGALVSVICSNALNRTVKEFHITEPGKILDKVRELVLETFEKSESEVQDGMDISLCCLHTKTLELLWSGAYNPLWYFQKGEMHELDADKQPIGKNNNPRPFQTHTVQLQKGDVIYLFTDGFADQFGGANEKKFKYNTLKEAVSKLAPLKMDEQKQKLDEIFETWRGKMEQTDDVCMLGIRV